MLAVAFVAGLVVGWNFLAQPQFAKDFVDKVKTWLGMS